MQRLKTNWLFKICTPGFLLILSLLLIAESILIWVADTNSQKGVVLISLIYFIWLILKKYSIYEKIITLIIAMIFSCLIYQNQKIQSLNLNKQVEIRLYPDEISIKDNWFSGIGQTITGKILLSGKINADKNILTSGRTIILSDITGEVIPITPATNLGEFNYQNYYLSKRITQKINLHHFKITTASDNLLTYFHKLRFQIKNYLNEMPQILGFFASELLLAENNSNENKNIIDNYRDLGVIHLLSISGLHVGIYTFIVSIICFWLKFTEEETFVFCNLILLMGIFLSNGQTGFIRASLSYFLGKLISFNKWKITNPDLLGLTCIIHLLWTPYLFTGIGAILSYVLACGLQLTSNFKPFWQSIALNLLLMPLLLFYFFQINLLTVLFNILIVPYFNFIVMPITFLNLILFYKIPAFSIFFENILKSTEVIINVLSKTKLGLFNFGQITWWQCILLLILTAVLLIYINEKKQNKVIKLNLIKFISVLYLIFFVVIHFPLGGQVSFIDVGQGDSILITTPFPRHVYMIDTGGKLNFSNKKMTPQIDKITIPLLKAMGINQIDGLFVSHQDADHVGDIKPLMKQIKVKKLYTAKGLIKNPSFKKRISTEMHNTQLIELLAGMEVREPQINFQVVYPFKEGLGKNEDSLSLTFKIANKRWLFTGDLGQDGERELINHFPLKVDYFKLGHHGSKTSSNFDFLKLISPRLVFISAGRNNRFNHPHQETLKTLKDLEIPWVSTQDCGMISWYYSMGSCNFKRFLMRSPK